MTVAALLIRYYLLLAEFLLAVCKSVNVAFPRKALLSLTFNKKMETQISQFLLIQREVQCVLVMVVSLNFSLLSYHLLCSSHRSGIIAKIPPTES